MAKLIRQRDNLTKEGTIKFIEFDKFNRGKGLHDEIRIGYSCVVDPHLGPSYTWMTSEITEVISETEFKTKNSHYKIEI